MNLDRVRAAIAAGVVVMVTAMTATAAQAARPSHFSDPVNFTYPLDYYTDLCGFPVYFSLVGTLNTTLGYDRSGRIVSELDTQPGTTETFSSPASGRSFSFPFASLLRTNYTNGGVLGSDAIPVEGRQREHLLPGVDDDPRQLVGHDRRQPVGRPFQLVARDRSGVDADEHGPGAR